MLWKLGIDNDVHEGCDNSGIRNVVYEGCDNSTIHNDVYEFVVIRIPKDVDKGTL